MNQLKFAFPFLILAFLFVVACQNSTTPEGTTSTQQQKPDDQTSVSTPNANPVEKNSLLHPWVTKLNIRNQPNLKGEVVASVNEGEALEFTNVNSEKAETIVLRGIAYHDFWYKIIYTDEKEGWVFGGAVKQKEEQKGNAPLTEMQFDYPKFGKYDLSNWELINIEALGEEVDGEIKAYKSGEYYFETSNPSMGEFGYSFTQALLTDVGEVIKRREFSFIPSTMEVEPHEMVETIEDHEQTPSKKYTRKQKIDKHYYSLNAKPMMVVGEWKEEIIATTTK